MRAERPATRMCQCPTDTHVTTLLPHSTLTTLGFPRKSLEAALRAELGPHNSSDCRILRAAAGQVDHDQPVRRRPRRVLYFCVVRDANMGHQLAGGNSS